MDQITAIYKAWLAHTGDTTYEDPEGEEEDNAEAWLSSSGAYLGQYNGYAELAESLVDDSGAIDDFWHERDNHSLAPYFKFDYEQYGRDLDLGGDVWSEEIEVPFGTAGHTMKQTHWFWSNY